MVVQDRSRLQVCSCRGGAEDCLEVHGVAWWCMLEVQGCRGEEVQRWCRGSMAEMAQMWCMMGGTVIRGARCRY